MFSKEYTARQSSKHQAPEKLQIPSSKASDIGAIWERMETWRLELLPLGCMGFGFWCYDSIRFPANLHPCSFVAMSAAAQQFSLWRRLETLSANLVGHFVEKSNLAQNSSTKWATKTRGRHKENCWLRPRKLRLEPIVPGGSRKLDRDRAGGSNDIDIRARDDISGL